jgi:flagellar hook assembly protein FlgD
MLSALPVNSVDSPGTFFHSYLAPGGSAWVDAGVDYFYRAVAQIDYAVQENTGVDERTFALMQNRPNPVKGATTIRFELPQRTETSLKVYDVNGRLVRTLFDEVKDAGAFTVQWNGMDGLGRTLPAGVYFYRLSAGEQVATRKLILTR